MRWLALALALSLVAAAHADSRLSDGTVAQTLCMNCHTNDSSGRIPVLENIRATPEGWSIIVERMNRNFKLDMDEATRRQAVVELSDALPLTPEEMADLRPVLISKVPGPDPPGLPALPPDFERVCLACHGYDVIASQRRTKESWMGVRDMHLGYFPVLFLTMRELQWDERATECLQALAARLPLQSPSWERFKPGPVAQKYWISGHEAGRGAYRGVIQLNDLQGKVTYVKDLTFENGSECREVGQARLVAGFLWQLKGTRAGQPPVSLESTVTPVGGHYLSLFSEPVQPWRVHGEETWSESGLYSSRPAFALARPGDKVTVELYTTAHTASPQVQVGDPGLKVNSAVYAGPEGPLKVELTVVSSRPGSHELSIQGVPGKVRLGVAPRIDFIKIVPEEPYARLGGIKGQPSSVQFEAHAMAEGPQGKRFTDEDLDLGVLPVRWSVSDYNGTNMDDDPAFVGKLDEKTGLFTPATEAPNPARNSLMNTGDVWVIARYQDLRARVLLRVCFPDYRIGTGI